jgi:hypothetical protein
LPKIVRKPGLRKRNAPAAEQLIASISFSYNQITQLRFLFIERTCYGLVIEQADRRFASF